MQQSTLATLNLSCCTGQQESKIESLEAIHAARMRSNSEAGTSKQQLVPAVMDAPMYESANQGLGDQDEETDPYSLPVSHEVALEGDTQLAL